MHARFRPPDHARGDETTIGGYAAVHDRPAAFEGADGFSYSVEIMADATADASAPWAAFFLFVRWARVGAQSPEGHLESDYVVIGEREADVRDLAGRAPLAEVRRILDALIAERADAQSGRRWWDAMRDDGDPS